MEKAGVKFSWLKARPKFAVINYHFSEISFRSMVGLMAPVIPIDAFRLQFGPLGREIRIGVLVGG